MELARDPGHGPGGQSGPGAPTASGGPNPGADGVTGPWLGSAGRPVRVLSFAGGGFNTAMQMGVTHALLIMRAEPPEVVAGISAGAIHATVLAEVMKAGEHLDTDEARQAKQVEIFNRFLEEELSAPVRLASTLTPDAYQVRSRAPLAPLTTPTQSTCERKDREHGVTARMELIRLVNDIVSFELTFGDLARIVRAILGYKAAGEAPTVVRARLSETKELLHVAWICMLAFRPLASIVRRIQNPLAKGLARRLWHRPRLAGPADDTKSGKSVGSSAAAIMFRGRIRTSILGALGWIPAVLISNGLLYLLLSRVAASATSTVRAWILSLVPGSDSAARPRRIPTPSPARSKMSLLGKLQELKDPLWWWKLLLEERQLDGSLLEPEVVRAHLVRVFDPSYYGAIDTDELDDAVRRSLANQKAPAHRRPKPRTVGRFGGGTRPLFLGIVAANLDTGDLTILPESTAIVDALLAATAVVPWFEVKGIKIRGKEAWFVDALNITREPTQVVMGLLKDRVHPEATEVLVYPVTHLTSAHQQVDTNSVPFPTWYEVAKRADQLKEFRDARLEWRLTDLISRMIPRGQILATASDGTGGRRNFLRAQIHPIEPDITLKLGEEISDAGSEAEREGAILTAVADGCRATMETVLRDSIAFPPGHVAGAEGRREVACWDVMSERLGGPSAAPGASIDTGPGLAQVCRQCVHRIGSDARVDDRRRWLRIPAGVKASGLDWPLAPRAGKLTGSVPGPVGAAECSIDAPVRKSEGVAEDPGEARFRRPPELAHWPHAREIGSILTAGKARPLVSVLFSGGVFRGVYLVGVVNALKELGIRPDIIAGASVGSVSAILAADVFARREPSEQSLQMARFASVFLTLDRFILTDTFADFVRTFTLRASETAFSLRDLDRVLRRYDEGDTDRMTADLRRVAAGLERLLYVSPPEFLDLARAVRYGKTREVKVRLVNHLHKWLRRDGAQWEVLGSDPLAQILHAYVLHRLCVQHDCDRSEVPFQAFLKDGIYLLATTTNLSRGELQLLGDVLSIGKADSARRGSVRGGGIPPSLLEGVLASSAFPGIFRPRWSWEVYRGRGNREQFTDGGVMDNLPLDAVAHFINSASLEGILDGRPRVRIGGAVEDVPHLLFTASLESDFDRGLGDRTGDFKHDWWGAYSRTKRLNANRKIESYKSAQRHLRSLYEERAHGTIPVAHDAFQPVNLEVVDVRPRWLCSTFAFHPMMGFRRKRQAESIAHGCATTLVKWGDVLRDPSRRPWAEAWGVRAEADQIPANEKFVPRRGIDPASGECAFRTIGICPFSAPALRHVGLPQETRLALEAIYHACRRPETHQPPHG